MSEEVVAERAAMVAGGSAAAPAGPAAAPTAAPAGPAAAVTPPIAIPVEDRRCVRSKRALRRALIDLMEERGLDSFTVNDLCDRADLNRGTFYNHFRDKDDLLVSCEDEVINGLGDLQNGIENLDLRRVMRYRIKKQPFPMLVMLFDYLREQGDFLHAVLGPGGDIRFAPRVSEAVCTHLITSVLHEKYRENPTVFVNYYVAYFASAFLGVIQRWVLTGMHESSEEMAQVLLALFFIKPGKPIEM